uniref:LapA family protein n=1 Tax=Caldilinea aerophila TaxID=133453 RepID=A0A7C1FSB7_9CHLR
MQEIWIAFFIGLMIGWLIEWLIDWRYWRPSVTALRQENEQLRQQLEQLKASIQTTQKRPTPSTREKIYN